MYTLERLKMLQKQFMGLEMSNSAIRFLEWIGKREKEEERQRREDLKFWGKYKRKRKRG